jgi:hypothetical protein
VTALRYIPGQVVAFGTESLQARFDESYLSAFGEAVSGRAYQFRSGIHWLELFVVNEGEELRFIDQVQAQPGVIAASLNYIGFGLAETYIDDDPPPERAYPPGRVAPRDTQYLFQSESDDMVSPPFADFDSLVDKLRDAWPSYLIAAVDVNPAHCSKVLSLIVDGLNYRLPNWDPAGKAPDGASVLGLTANIDNSEITDLHGITDRLSLLAELVGPKYSLDCQVLAINLSVDFSQIIRGYNALDPASAESPDMVYSFPFFERALSRVVADLSHEGPPAVFAAAGNRLKAGDRLRVRLGYPANRIETIAATFVTTDPADQESATPVDWVDVPATTGLKPCFAIDVNAMSIPERDGSSYASAWLAGHYTALALRSPDNPEDLGLLSKTAWLMRRTERRRLPSGRQRLPCFAAVIRPNEVVERAAWDLDNLLAFLKAAFGADFCVHGSTATIGEWLRLNGHHLTDIAPVAKKDLGDLDMLYWGNLEVEEIEGAVNLAQEWLKGQLGRSWLASQKRPIELHPYEGLMTKAARLRSVTPVTKLYITAGGVIDTWGGLDDLRRRQIRFLPMTHPDFWAQNSLFSSNADCLALNILQWISSIALLQLVSHSVKIAGPAPDPESVAKVQEILSVVEAGSPQIPLFSPRITDIRERVDRRLDRAETLMGSCARQKIVDKTLDQILRTLRKLRQKIE